MKGGGHSTTVLKSIAGWFDNYNDNHPHSGLKMCSPRELIERFPSPWLVHKAFTKA